VFMAPMFCLTAMQMVTAKIPNGFMACVSRHVNYGARMPTHKTVFVQIYGKLTLSASEPVFSEPWQAQAFAMAVSLQEQGIIMAAQWAEALGAQISATAKPDDVSENDHYYHCWLAALEILVEQTGLIDRTERMDRQQAWDKAARATPHGQPIELGREKSQ